ncbi:TIGR01777 family protein [Flaviflexus ciconiae]|uniref:TIGR01777 family protein n=1 Tax=Flaviflexus ciconiae TaxID=2496867 RepID=A0A3Q9G6H3_9ACTO|nr:TIGR01777 family oxidoreductase [Flaviflexus ciconiae]AZQ76281.1 TIGR01777 family protein [Flaviflexus ciconiae]
MKLIVSGATGFIGTALTKRAETKGWDVTKIVRSNPAPGDITFDPQSGTIDERQLAGADAVVCLNGAGLFSRPWTDSYKKTLLESRLTSVNTLTEAFARLEEPDRPTHFLTGSAIGYYGAGRGDEILTEESGPGSDFLADLCVQWERAGHVATDLGIRHSALRTGLVMDSGGGMLGLFKHLYRAGLGTKLGSGEQWMSTISLDDHVRATLYAIENQLEGPINLSSPEPLRNADWHRLLAAYVHRPAFLTAPAPVMKLALGDFAEQAALASQRVMPRYLEDAGFEFSAPTVLEIFDQALPPKK